MRKRPGKIAETSTRESARILAEAGDAKAIAWLNAKKEHGKRQRAESTQARRARHAEAGKQR